MNQETCCPPFNPESWDGREVVWNQETFVKDRVRCLFHIPVNFGAKMVKNVKALEAAGALPEETDFLVLSNNDSLWGMDLYLKTTKAVPGANNVTISGAFSAKVFEGPYQNTPRWIEAMKQYVLAKGQEMKDLFFFYTTCPKCAKKYGKNYVVLLAKTG